MTGDALSMLQAVGGTLGADAAAAKALIVFFEDMAAHKASIDEAIAAGLSTAKAVAQYVPIASEAVSVLEAAQVLDAVYRALPANWRFIKTEHGPLKDVFDDKTPPERIFGFTPDP